MNKLEAYKKLSDQDKMNLTEYEFYNSIYNINPKASDQDVLFLYEECNSIWLNDEFLNLSISKITSFISKYYFNGTLTKEMFDEVSSSDFLEAIDNDCIELIDGQKKRKKNKKWI